MSKIDMVEFHKITYKIITDDDGKKSIIEETDEIICRTKMFKVLISLIEKLCKKERV